MGEKCYFNVLLENKLYFLREVLDSQKSCIVQSSVFLHSVLFSVNILNNSGIFVTANDRCDNDNDR